jgi:hypothetical protein
MEERNVKHRIAAIALGLSTLACAGGGAPGTPGPETPLAYGMPPASPLVYTTADTMYMDMDVGGQAVQVSVKAAATVETSFTDAGGVLNVEIRYTDISGSFTNSMAPTIPLSNSDIPGPATVTVAPDGAVTVVQLPEASEAFRQVLGAESSYHRFFVRLPATVVQPGDMWTDTVSIAEDIGGMSSESSHIVTSTLVGDTLVDGRRLQVITSDIAGTTTIAGMTQGMEIRQFINNASTATTLWDPARRAVWERVETGTSQGSMELPAMGMSGIPIQMSSTAVLRLRDR